MTDLASPLQQDTTNTV